MDGLKPDELAQLDGLDRGLLHVFVAGPGVGEGLAIALPGAGWVLVDGCRAGGDLPLREILSRWRAADESVEAYVFTHPHADHADGIAELVEATAPLRICVAGATRPERHVFQLARDAAKGDSADADEFGSFALAREVLNALQAMRTWEEDLQRKVDAWYDGCSLQIGAVQILVRAPSGGEVRAFMRRGGAVERLRKRANDLSLVVEVRFGRCRVVLGGDLPRLRGNAKVASGWDAVMRRHGHLGTHSGFKVPHHGSREALHPKMNTARGQDERAWLVTPYNASHLPRFDPEEGAQALLASEPRLLVTAMPASRATAGGRLPASGVIRRSQIVARSTVQPTGNPFVDGGRDVRPAKRMRPLDAVWCVAFDQTGALRGLWRGREAFVLEE
ncbi:MAG: MBL fold metallo-hydrolase [Deltaproteobacteria bacterium]|nr:MBL fold metallo-hydrolase [Deltaproteobacteria bacterium]